MPLSASRYGIFAGDHAGANQSRARFQFSADWLDTFNVLGGIAPFIRSLWNQWWLLDTPGKAVCALQYAAHLIYPVEVNPLWPEGSWQWQPPLGATEEPWLENNLAF